MPDDGSLAYEIYEGTGTETEMVGLQPPSYRIVSGYQ